MAEKEYKAIVMMSLEWVCIAAIIAAVFIKVNPAFSHVLGFSVKQLLAKSSFDFIHPPGCQCDLETPQHERAVPINTQYSK
jgi:hypothetical protein